MKLIYGTCHKKLYNIRGFAAWVFRRSSAESAEIFRGMSAEASKGIRGIVKGYPRNPQRVSVESSKGICGFV